ncbi:MAG: 4Fe-4S binding protein, partial [Deltaproteobacteria bacterium]|nr:4Fe-4S binding protein [Deltaproteobacteria bacterium]
MNEDIYTKLREFFHSLPGGYPATDTGVEIKILEKLYTPEEADLTMKLKERPERVADIASRLGMNEAGLAEQLENMAQKGIIYRVREGEERLYRVYQFLVGIYEFQLKHLDREFAELFEEYLPYYGMGMAEVKTGQMRTIPLGSAIDSTTEVATYNNIRELIKDKNFISVQNCICRKEQALLGNECDYPKEICLGFGDFAQYYVDNGMGRQIDMAETLKLLDAAEKAGLVLMPTNSQDVEAICCCCSCCCPNLRFAKMMTRPIDMVQTHYVSKIDPNLCTACEECQERCPMDAIKIDDSVSEIIDGRCI